MEGRSVPSILHQYEDWVGVEVYWLIFGPNGREKWECGLVIEIFQGHTEVEYHRNRFAKTIVNPRWVRFMDVHMAIYWKTKYGRNLCGMFDKYAYQTLKRPPCYERLRLHHYFTKSIEEWTLKRRRGRAYLPSEYEFSMISTINDSVYDTMIDWAVPLVKWNLRLRGQWKCESSTETSFSNSASD
jgi:hypothetical protein